MKHFIKYILLFLILAIAQVGHSQGWNLILEMVVTEEGRPTSGAEVNLYKDGSFVKKVYSGSKGVVELKLEPNGIYRVDIGGSDNFVKKKLQINTKDVPTEAFTQDTYFPAEVDIFRKLKGLDYNVLNDPIGKIAYDTKTENFEVDRAYTVQMQLKLKALEDSHLAEMKKIEAQYKNVIREADKAFKSQEWELAKEKYEKATELKPLETYPSFQLAELKTKLIEINKTNQRYDEAIAEGDAAVKEKDYKIAIASYERAIRLKANEAYPQAKLKEVKDLLANQAKIDQDYIAAITQGDNALNVRELSVAKTAFEKAAELKPNEQYPKNKLAELNDILGKQEAKEQEYQAAISTGDEALEKQEFTAAKAAYQKAKGLKPSESYPVDQIAKVEGMMAAAAKKDQNYLAAVQQGESALQEKKFEAAIKAFEEAQSIKPAEEYPKNKIKEINDFVAKQAIKDKQYEDKIVAADKAFADKSYETAKVAYQEAIKIKPNENYPLDQIAKVETALNTIAKNEENYSSAIKKGDNALAAKDYKLAKLAFQEALSIKGEEQYPKSKISEIETIVVKIEQDQMAYQQAIKDADAALAEEDYERAKKFYNDASEINNQEQYPKDKIAAIEKKLAELQELEAAYTAAIEKGDLAKGVDKLEEARTAYEKALAVKADASYPQKQIAEINEELKNRKEAAEAYQTAIKDGEEAVSRKEYQKALTAFQMALSLRGNESYPKDKIAEIEKLLAEKESAEANYQAAIEKADAAFGKEEWEIAKSAYESALAVKAEEYPKSQINEIEKKLTEIAEREKATAKLDADYQKAINDGDAKLEESNLEGALAAYEKAKLLKPEESYPNNKIDEIKVAQEQLAKDEAEKERLAKIEVEYKAIISRADKAMKSKNLNEARDEYQAALAVKSEESYPKDKIEEINGILADAKEQDAAYQSAIADADKLFSEEKLEAAKEKFAAAASIKSEEQYPKDKIAEIDKKLGELAAKEEEIRLQNEKAAAVDAKYQGLVAAADQAFESENYEEAKQQYEAALSVKDDAYPRQQIAAIGERLMALESQEAAAAQAAEQAKIDAKYQGLIAEADQLLEEGKLESAKGKYQSAIEVKDESYPKEKISEINKQIEAIALKEQEKEKEAKKAEQEIAYQTFIKEGDALLAELKLKEAKEKYISAITIKEDFYPASKITEIDQQLEALEVAKAEKQKQAQLTESYNAAILEADQFFEKKDYNKAIDSYQSALRIKSDEAYPNERIETAKSLLAEQGEKAAQIDAKYQAFLASADQALEEKEYVKAKSNYENALALKPNESYPSNKITEIENLLSQQAQRAEEIRLQNEREAKAEVDYEKSITKADQLFSETELERALNEYKLAQNLMPSKEYPQKQIDRINDLLTKRQLAIEDAKRQKEAEAAAAERYEDLLISADEALRNKQYRLAKREYQAALNIKADEIYPKEQLQKIEAVLEKQREKELAESKKLDEPIRIQTGPRATVDKSTEDKIDEIYEEIWAKKEQEKRDKIAEKEKTVYELGDKQREEEHQKRQKAHERIEGIAISLQKQQENVSTLNMQNYEAIVEKEKAMEKYQIDKEREAEKKRNDAYAQNKRYESNIVDAQNEQKENQKLQNAQIEALYKNLEKNHLAREEKQQERIGLSKTKAEQKADAIQEYTSKRNEEHLHANTAQLKETESNWEQTQSHYKSSSEEHIEANYKAIKEKQLAIDDFNKSMANSFDKNQSDIEERTKNYKQFDDLKRKQSQEKIKIEQAENERILLNQEERLKQKGENHIEAQKAIDAKETALEERRRSLEEDAKKRREENAAKEYYRGESKAREDQAAARHPQGVTETVIEGGNSTTIRRTVVNGTEVNIYEKTLHNYGEVYFTKNGTSITKEAWDKESVE